MIPGINLLNVAMGLIGSQPVVYYRSLGEQTLANGVKTETFAEGVPVDGGSVQAVPRDAYSELGLNFKRDYVNWFVSVDVVGVDRDASGDEFTYAGKRYKIYNTTPWYSQDGWIEALSWEINDRGASA